MTKYVPTEFKKRSMSREERFVMSLVILIAAILVCFFGSVLFQSIFPEDTSGRGRHPRVKTPQNIGLSLHYYASDHDGFLPPSVLGADQHGWATSLLPYFDMEAEFNSLHLDRMWNDPPNQPVTRSFITNLKNPGIEETANANGYPLNHYAANSRIIQPGKQMTLDEISQADGLTNTILLGEIGGHFQPWAAPGSRRDPAEGIGQRPNQFGIPDSQLVIFTFGDGSARPVNTDIDPKILKAWATPDGGEIIPEQ